jgi:hypothetical protein
MPIADRGTNFQRPVLDFLALVLVSIRPVKKNGDDDKGADGANPTADHFNLFFRERDNVSTGPGKKVGLLGRHRRDGNTVCHRSYLLTYRIEWNPCRSSGRGTKPIATAAMTNPMPMAAASSINASIARVGSIRKCGKAKSTPCDP